MSNKILWILIAAAVAGLVVAEAIAPPPTAPAPIPYSLPIGPTISPPGPAEQLLAAINRAPGTTCGLADQHPALTQQAQLHADWMATHGSMSHWGLGDRSAAIRQQLGQVQSREIVAWVGSDLSPTRACDRIVQLWLSSPPHRAVLYSRPRWIGVGLAKGSRGWYGCVRTAT